MSQYDQNTFESLYNDGSVGKPFQTNTSRAITEAVFRQFAKDISDSMVYTIGQLNTDIAFFYQDDLFTLAGSTTVGSVSASPTGVNSTEKAIGVMQLQIAAVSDVSVLYYGSSSSVLFGLGHTVIGRCRFNLATISNGTDRFKLNLGFGSVTAASDHSDGAYFRYSDNINGGKYQCVTVQAGVETTSDSGITPSATVFDVFEVRINDTGTQVSFAINGTIVQVHLTNIPIVNQVSLMMKAYKTVGATARNFFADWYSLQLTRTAAR